MNYETKTCSVCGCEFRPFRANIRTCDNPECKKEAKKQRPREWYAKNYLSARAQKRDYMRRVRAEEHLPGPHVRKPDTIVAIGYADRQREQTLKMVGRVKVEL